MASYRTEGEVTFADKALGGRDVQLNRSLAPNGFTVTVAVDITDRKAAEREVAQSGGTRVQPAE